MMKICSNSPKWLRWFYAAVPLFMLLLPLPGTFAPNTSPLFLCARPQSSKEVLVRGKARTIGRY